MKLLPFEKCEIESAVSADKLLAALVARSAGKHSIDGSTEPLVGEVEGNGFKCCRAITYRNSFLPIAVGKVIKNGNGSIIKFYLRPSVFSSIFMFFWFTPTFLISILLLIQGNTAKTVAPIALMFIFGYLLLQLCFWLEIPKIKEIFHEIIES